MSQLPPIDDRSAAVVAGACGCMDLVLVVDDTGSMGPAIANVRTGLNDIIAAAQTASGGDLRVGLISFKDHPEVDVDLTTDIAGLTSAVSALYASGGDGEPEASDEAMRLALTGATSCGTASFGALRGGCSKIVVLVTDARPGGCDDAYTPGVDDANAAAQADLASANGVLISAVHVTDGYLDAEAAAILTQYATTTGGFYTEAPSTGEGTGSAIQSIVERCGAAPGGCPRSQGYWKNHPDAWPTDQLLLGGVSYSQQALLGLLSTPVRGDASLVLAKQLIAASLNAAAGADTDPIAGELAATEVLLAAHAPQALPLQVSARTSAGRQMTALAGALEHFNTMAAAELAQCQPE